MGGLKRYVPSAITLGGLLLAFWSISMSLDGRYEAAAWLVFAAAMADVFDGAAARALGIISSFGQQLDSLTDLVTAGVAPAILVHEVYFAQWGTAGFFISASWLLAVAVRLARFNTSAPDPLFFAGVPCPIAATLLTQYLVFSQASFDNLGRAGVAAALVLAMAGLMLSTVPYWKSATLMPSQFRSHAYGPGTAATALGLAVAPRQALFVGTAASVVGALVRYGANSVSARRVAPLAGTTGTG